MMVRAHVHTCAAKNCLNSRLTHPEKEFFCFPNDVKLCKTWLRNSERTDLDAGKVSRSAGCYKLCADHFEDKWFIDDTRRWLDHSHNPVPTIFSIPDNPLSRAPHATSAKGIDLPLDSDGSARMYECVLDPYELMTAVDRHPVSYHSIHPIRTKEMDGESLTAILISLNSNTELHKIDDMCRFCMDTISENYIDIFENSVEATGLREICEELMLSKVNVCDGFPHKICRMCTNDLKTCHKLMEKFKKAYRYLQQIAKYSLFIENEDDCDANDNEDSSEFTESELSKPLPKNALAIPLKNFTPSYENFQGSLEETNFQEKEDSINSNDGVVPYEQQELFASDSPNKNTLELDNGDSAPHINESEDVKQFEFVNCRPLSGQPDEQEELCENLNKPDKNSDQNTGILFTKLPFPEEIKILYKCLECSRMFISRSILAEHIKSSHRKCKNFSCIVCAKRFRSSKLVSEHHKKEHPDFKILCPICGEKCDSERELRKHHKTTHSFRYTQCNKALYSRQNLNINLGYKHNINTECDTYSGKFVQSVYNEMQDPCNREICYVCGIVLKNKISFRRHMQIHEGKVIHCKECGKAFNSSQALFRHKRLFHLQQNREKTFLCQYCPKIFLEKSTLDKHLLVHSTEKLFHCEFCNLGFNHRRNFVQHVKRREVLGGVCPRQRKKGEGNSKVSKGAPKKKPAPPTKEDLECDVCQRTFIRVANVKKHRKYHFCPKGDPEIIQKLLNEPEIHKCDVCGLTLFSKTALQYHSRKHTGSTKPFQCEFCKKFYSTYSMMYIHERTHTGETPFQCQYCDRGFGNKLKLVSHEMEHTDERPHVCEICQKAFKTRKYLTTHTRRHKDATSIRPHQCTQCSKRFMTEGNLKQHVEVIHKSGNPDENGSYICPICDKAFLNQVSRQRHIDMKHRVLEEKQNEDGVKVIEADETKSAVNSLKIFESQ